MRIMRFWIGLVFCCGLLSFMFIVWLWCCKLVGGGLLVVIVGCGGLFWILMYGYS